MTMKGFPNDMQVVQKLYLLYAQGKTSLFLNTMREQDKIDLLDGAIIIDHTSMQDFSNVHEICM